MRYSDLKSYQGGAKMFATFLQVQWLLFNCRQPCKLFKMLVRDYSPIVGCHPDQHLKKSHSTYAKIAEGYEEKRQKGDSSIRLLVLYACSFRICEYYHLTTEHPILEIAILKLNNSV